MNPVRWRATAAILFALSTVFLASVLVLPLVKTPQHSVYRGPATPYVGGDTSISGYYIPTVDSGTTITVSVDDFRAGALDISIFPSQVGGVSPSGPPVYFKTPLINTTEFFRADQTQPYGIYVISRNYTAFTIIIEATYSPYYWLTGYDTIGVSAAFAAGILLYYYSFTSKRWRLEQEAIREATSH